MAFDSYLERLKKARKLTQDRIEAELPKAKVLLDRALETTSEVTAKTASAVSDSCSQAVDKAKQSLENGDLQRAGERLKEAGLASQKAMIEAKRKAQELMRKPDSSGADSEVDQSEEASIRNAIEKMSGRDKVGLAGEHLAAAGGAAAGVAAAGTIAGAAGATTLLGSTGLAGMLGGVFVTTTPVGWVLGSAVVMGAAGYGIAKLIRSGSEQDRVRQEFIQRQTERLMALEEAKAPQDEKVELGQLMALTLDAGVLDQADASRMVDLVDAGKLPVALALERMRSLALESQLIEVNPGPSD
ncbi:MULTISPECIES: hypothetical protein [Pseudomonas]|uniref:hypothetical protein n=1 Tax=Pseudomonas TaxID=286 RepID=UPI000B48AD24|nr:MULTISPECIES: hypothetical protein [Pseudomonas]MCU9100521.1 hypothetical protein [Pseudomonas aeruginosa]MCU9249851.1 hypothetical protein [Pseudomonas aeruginosa]MCU9301161.1 hypothetical protein [Pseudomonas aeruginosa]MCU9506673.1 hypothetical protein [Pseudomonas aeruginosa]MDG1580585.1 hypothetical protein [Pseudomonas sp. GOM6]